MTIRSTKIDCSDSVNEYINKEDWRIKANANTGYSAAGLVNNLAGKVIANFWFDDVYSKEEGDAHRNGDYHIHDSDCLTPYCCGHDLQRLLQEGFNGVVSRVSSRPPKHIREALYQMANFIGILQAEWAGAQAFSSFDTYLAPYVFYDMQVHGLSERDIKKAILNFVYNLNVPSRWGQSPFSNVTIDWTVPNSLKDIAPMRYDEPYFVNVYKEGKEKGYENIDNLIIEGRKRIGDENADVDTVLYSLTYKHFKPEMDIINRCFYQILSEGDDNGQPFTFPIPTINITEDFDWDNPNCYWLFENAAKYGSSYFQNFIGSQYLRDKNGKLTIKDENAYSPNDVRSMCPLTSDTEVIVESNSNIYIRKIGEMFNCQNTKGASYKSYYKGAWSNCKVIKVENQDVYSILMANNIECKMGGYHEQPILRDGKCITVSAQDIKVGDYIPFNNSVIEGKINASYDFGFAIGAYLGDGSKDSDGINYSLCADKVDDNITNQLTKFFESLGFRVTVSITNKLRSLRVGTGAFNLISRFITDDNALNKGLSKNVLNLSVDARRGILDGLIASDGEAIKKRISTSSKNMVESVISLASSIGVIAYLSYVDTRDNRLSNNPNYIITVVREKKNYKNKFLTVDNQLYMAVTSVNKLDSYKGDLYCLAVDNDSHLFTLANGIITHNCRLQLDKKALRKRGGGLFGSDAQTGSIGVVTLNMARLGYLYKGDMQGMLNRIKELCDMAKSTLEKKRTFVKKMNEQGLYPYTRRYVRTFDTYFSTIGVNGMNEMIKNFTNDEYDITDSRGQKMACDILDYINSLLLKYQEETGNLYNLEATPAEGTTYRFAKIDKKKYPDIIQAGFEDAPYYTNSSQLPVDFSADPFAVLELQDELQKKYTGGTVLHLYMSERLSSAEVCKNLVKKVLTNYRLPYISITPSFSVCPKHGYISGDHDFCPLCDKEILAKHANEVDFNL